MPVLPLLFTVPWVLAALAALPALYILLRITPPRPNQVPFPPLRLFYDLARTEETPHRTPWWLLLLRLVLAAGLIIAMAGPILNPLPPLAGSAQALLLVVDNGWASAPSFADRIAAANQRIEAASQKGVPVALIASSDGAREIIATDGAKALEHLRALQPVPYLPDRLALLPQIKKFIAGHPDTALIWMNDGLEKGAARAFAEKLEALQTHLAVVSDTAPVLALAGPRNTGSSLDVSVLRSKASGSPQGLVRALDRKGLAIGDAPFDLAQNAAANASFTMPVELRNEIARLEIVGEHSTGAVALLDDRWKRRLIGVLSGETADLAQPLLAPNYFLAKALTPFADVRQPRPGTAGPIAELIDQHVAVLILADIGSVSAPAHAALQHFVEQGGVLVRFAGTRLAQASDDLVPVRLRKGGRVLGGSLSWDQPKKLGPFDEKSPFYGLQVPPEVTVSRQVLAEPDPGLAGKTWAQLSDGTPLVTAEQRGKGMIILFHVTADTTWSNLPLSGLFVDMLRKIVSLAGEGAQADTQAANQGAATPTTALSTQMVEPYRLLDGFGVLGQAPPTVKPLPANYEGAADAEHPPGFYGPQEALIAVNALNPGETIPGADFSGLDLSTEPLRAEKPVDLRPFLLVAAFLLFVADSLASLWLAGSLRFMRGATALLVLCSLVAFAPMRPARAEAVVNPPTLSKQDMESALTTRLAYVATGDAKVDEASRLGLLSLSHALAQRTSLDPGEPVSVDPAKDDLAFYPLLYWPIVAGSPQPPQGAVAKLASFMKQGGTILFDTRDALTARPEGSSTPEALWLRKLLDGVDVPELEPVPPDHVVTKTFYLIDGFIGRYANGKTWIEALPAAPAEGAPRPVRAGDSVSPIIITGNDLAAGWASDTEGESYYSLVPGGHRQHELALRGGINLVMYTLTGNYKADQVHVRDLLERLAH